MRVESWGHAPNTLEVEILDYFKTSSLAIQSTNYQETWLDRTFTKRKN